MYSVNNLVFGILLCTIGAAAVFILGARLGLSYKEGGLKRLLILLLTGALAVAVNQAGCRIWSTEQANFENSPEHQKRLQAEGEALEKYFSSSQTGQPIAASECWWLNDEVFLTGANAYSRFEPYRDILEKRLGPLTEGEDFAEYYFNKVRPALFWQYQLVYAPPKQTKKDEPGATTPADEGRR